ncbi:hypothetical protein PgNI_05367 [Pyricularia grisea]|uniref:Uncharacterized protein n=1 Tax=Pyricularia grisea TaxID=148305 RepID=A0A6P8B7M4_PYRGI|nr:hypothetical protein PgNI_05367 [Pyricularia grisea]TLD11275.1 hypothetical protein PgNI_05367 [Pyricularia grisea]
MPHDLLRIVPLSHNGNGAPPDIAPQKTLGVNVWTGHEFPALRANPAVNGDSYMLTRAGTMRRCPGHAGEAHSGA